jgi:hypothetical protein
MAVACVDHVVNAIKLLYLHQLHTEGKAVQQHTPLQI